MQNKSSYTLSKRADVLSQFSISNTTLHERINEGLLPPSVSTGARSVAWVQQELDSVLKAMIAGKSKEEIKALIVHLVEQRSKLVA